MHGERYAFALDRSRYEGLSAVEIDAFLAEALTWATVSELPVVAELAIQIGGPASQRKVIQRLGDLDDRGMDQLARTSGSLAPITVAMVQARDCSAGFFRLCSLIARRGDLPALRVIAQHPVLREPGASEGAPIGDRIAQHLLRGTVRLLGRSGSRTHAQETRRAIDAMLGDVVTAWERDRRPALLMAIAIGLVRGGPLLHERIELAGEACLQSLRAVCRLVDEPLVSANLIRWMGIGVLSASAARRLDVHLTGADPSRVLADGHLLRSPARRVLLRRLERPGRVLDILLARAPSMPIRARLAILQICASAALSAQGRIRRLEHLASDPSPVVRLRAADACALLRPGRPLPPSLRPWAGWLEESPVRSGGGIAREGGNQKPDAEELSRIVQAMHHPDPAVVLRAIGRIRRRRWVEMTEELLLEAAHAEDPRVVSAAVALLPFGHMTERVERVRACLGHDDHRVVANAVEAAGRVREVLPDVEGFTDAEHNRIRANAVRAMLAGERPGAMMELKRMLDDPHPLHRISALWVARVTRATDVLDQLTRIMSHERVHAVRQRAGVARRFVCANAACSAGVQRRGRDRRDPESAGVS